MKNIIKQIKKEDFVISVRPTLDSKRNWTGEVDLSIITSVDNPLTDDDYYGLLSFCKVVCSSVPVMEEDEYVRDKLEDKAAIFDDVVVTPKKKKAKIVDKHDNVVVLSFDADTEGNA